MERLRARGLGEGGARLGVASLADAAARQQDEVLRPHAACQRLGYKGFRGFTGTSHIGGWP